MARVRSPNYPAISLPDAIQRVKRIYEQENHLSVAKDVIAKHLGYSGLNGASLKLISAIGKYGLLEDAGDGQARVSPLAITILFPDSDNAKSAAIREAAAQPALFAEMLDQWDGHIPSDANIRSYLARRNFAQSAMDTVIQSFRETMALVTPESGGYDSSAVKKKEEPMTATHIPSREPKNIRPPMTGDAPFRVALEGDAIEVAGRLTKPEDVEKLIKILELNKIMITPVYEANDTGNLENDDPAE